jgi:nitrite reductase/ring-hydroxylating ferredoxin subunit
MATEHETEPTPAPTPVSTSGHDVSRRGVMRGAAVGGLALPVLAACGGGGSASGGSSGGANGGGGASGDLAATADIPSGGGTVFPEQKVVVTQPADGEFKAFTAVCTHQGCIVASVADGTINCDCHGSKFSIEDGSVANGPATSPLEEVEITVKGGEITLA